MLAQSASARSLQKSVMDGYNYKLAGRVHSWAAKHPGVSLPLPSTVQSASEGTHRTDALAQVKAYIWDANVGFNNVLNDPKKYEIGRAHV